MGVGGVGGWGGGGREDGMEGGKGASKGGGQRVQGADEVSSADPALVL